MSQATTVYEFPVMRPKLASAEQAVTYLRVMDENRVYTNFGPLVQLLERRYATKLNVDPERIVVTSSATACLEILVGMQDQDRIAVPTYSFAATALSVLVAGKKIVWADVEKNSMMPSLETFRNLARSGSAPLIVTPFGKPFNPTYFGVSDRGIVDAAASLGSAIITPPDVPDGWAMVFSLHATKVLGVGEGGIALFGSVAQACEFRSRMNFGYRNELIGQTFGTNRKLSEVAAAYGLAALDGLETEKDEWILSHKVATSALASLAIDSFHDDEPGFHPYVLGIFPSKETRDEAENLLQRNGVGVRRWWAESLPKLPVFSKVAPSQAPGAEEWADRILGLPKYREDTEPAYQRIIETLTPSR